MKHKILLVFFLISLAFMFPVFVFANPFNIHLLSNSTFLLFSPKDNKVGVHIVYNMSKLSNMLNSRLYMENQVQLNLDDLFLKTILPLPISSDMSLYDAIKMYPDLFQHLESLVKKLNLDYSDFNIISSNLTMQYSLPIYSQLVQQIFPLITEHKALFPWLSNYNSVKYTGVLIFIPKKDIYDHPLKLQQALLPKIVTSHGAVLWDSNMVSPSILLSRGPLIYISKLSAINQANIQKILGKHPFKILASAVSGMKYKCNIVVSKSMISPLFSNNTNISLLKQGKIVVVIQ